MFPDRLLGWDVMRSSQWYRSTCLRLWPIFLTPSPNHSETRGVHVYIWCSTESGCKCGLNLRVFCSMVCLYIIRAPSGSDMRADWFSLFVPLKTQVYVISVSEKLSICFPYLHYLNASKNNKWISHDVIKQTVISPYLTLCLGSLPCNDKELLTDVFNLVSLFL